MGTGLYYENLINANVDVKGCLASGGFGGCVINSISDFSIANIESINQEEEVITQIYLSCHSFDFKDDLGDGQSSCIENLVLSKSIRSVPSGQTEPFCLHFTLPKTRYWDDPDLPVDPISTGRAADCAALAMNKAAIATGATYAGLPNTVADYFLIDLLKANFKKMMVGTNCEYGVAGDCENNNCLSVMNANYIPGEWSWMLEQTFFDCE